MTNGPSSTIDDYNYSTFTSSEARGKTRAFIGVLHAGDAAPDFELRTPEGEVVKLSDFRGRKHVVLEFGAIT